jgi:uncharacterized protein (DUF1501 family)
MSGLKEVAIRGAMTLGAGGTIWAEDSTGNKALVATLNLKDLTVPEAFAYAEAFVQGVESYGAAARIAALEAELEAEKMRHAQAFSAGWDAARQETAHD